MFVAVSLNKSVFWDAYDETQLKIEWLSTEPIIWNDIKLPDMELSSVITGKCPATYAIGECAAARTAGETNWRSRQACGAAWRPCSWWSARSCTTSCRATYPPRSWWSSRGSASGSTSTRCPAASRSASPRCSRWPRRPRPPASPCRRFSLPSSPHPNLITWLPAGLSKLPAIWSHRCVYPQVRNALSDTVIVNQQIQRRVFPQYEQIFALHWIVFQQGQIGCSANFRCRT